MKYAYNPPLLLKKLFSSFQWESKTGKILLTFDDGPVQGNTEIILKKLNEYNLKAAFFCVGENIGKYPELANEIISEGHLIGNHTFNHKNLTETGYDESNEQIDRFNNILLEKFNYPVMYFRPPYGRFNLSASKLLSARSLRNVMWSLLTYDFNNDFSKVKFAVDKYLQQNSIIVLHDNNKCRDIITDSIQYVIDSAANKGYKIGTPEECLKPFS